MATRKLSQTVCDRNKKPGYLNDGHGLYLATKKNPKTGVLTKSWVFRFRDPNDRYTQGPSNGLGRLREHGLGSFETYDLEKARKLAKVCRQELAEQKNPISEARRRKSKRQQEQAKQVTFHWCAQQLIAAKSLGWKNPKNAQQWHNTLEAYAKPINKLIVSDIDTPDVRRCLDSIWNTKTETASRVRGRIEAVLSWATASGYREGLNPARWETHLKQVYAAPELVKKQRRAKEGKSAHHASLDYREIGAFMALLRAETSIQARCLELIVLTSVRASEATQAQWDQFNLDEKYWRVPEVAMKVSGQDHLVPLSKQTIRMLKALPRLDEVYLFPSPQRQRKGEHKSISDNAVLILAKKLKAGITVHGFRSSMMTWAAEKTKHAREVRELALAHTEGSKTVAAYLHTDMYVKRAELMKGWNNFCDLPSGHKATVTPISKGAAA